jgi:hypothetical protein
MRHVNEQAWGVAALSVLGFSTLHAAPVITNGSFEAVQITSSFSTIRLIFSGGPIPAMSVMRFFGTSISTFAATATALFPTRERVKAINS